MLGNKIILTPKRKIIDENYETFRMIKQVAAASLPEQRGEVPYSKTVEVKFKMQLIPKRKLIGIDEIVPITNLLGHMGRLQKPQINWSGGGVISRTERAVANTVSLAGGGGQATKTETAITASVSLALL